MPSFTLKIRIGKIGVSPFPRPASCASISFSDTMRPSGEVSVPKLMLENGTCAPALECIVFRLWTKPSIAWICKLLCFLCCFFIGKSILPAAADCHPGHILLLSISFNFCNKCRIHTQGRTCISFLFNCFDFIPDIAVK